MITTKHISFKENILHALFSQAVGHATVEATVWSMHNIFICIRGIPHVTFTFRIYIHFSKRRMIKKKFKEKLRLEVQHYEEQKLREEQNTLQMPHFLR